MPTLTVKTAHILKLKKLGVYDKWLANLKAQYSNGYTGNFVTLETLTKRSNSGQWGSFVSLSFIFRETPEGHDFWMRIV